MVEDKEIGEEFGIYSKEGREDQIDEDEITDLDEGFMRGYEEGEKMAKCPLCGVVLDQDFVEREIDGEIYRFCCEEHMEIFIRNYKRE
jgi:YHS domain-containing protein